jgi:hypothetical protein
MLTKSVIYFSLWAAIAIPHNCHAQLKQSEDRDNHASVIRIVALPGDFDGEAVQVYGALRIIEDSPKYISAMVCTEADSARKKIRPNCIYVEFPKSAAYVKKMNGKYVLINGIFSRSLNVIEMYVGTLSAVTSAEIIERP